MQNSKHINAADIPAYAKLVLDSVTGVVDLVEAMHATIARRASPFSQHADPNFCSAIAEDQKAVLCEMNHFDSLDSPEVFAQLRSWLGSRATYSFYCRDRLSIENRYS